MSNVLTSEFQSAILLKCQDETEQSLVDYLCHGQGLLLLQMLCILASKVIGLYVLYMYMLIDQNEIQVKMRCKCLVILIIHGS